MARVAHGIRALIKLPVKAESRMRAIASKRALSKSNFEIMRYRNVRVVFSG